MKALITGNLGYVGPGVIREFRKHYPSCELVGGNLLPSAPRSKPRGGHPERSEGSQGS